MSEIYKASARMIKSSVQKTALVANLVRGKKDILVGKDATLRRFHARARGRASKIKKHYSRITVLVKELKVS